MKAPPPRSVNCTSRVTSRPDISSPASWNLRAKPYSLLVRWNRYRMSPCTFRWSLTKVALPPTVVVGENAVTVICVGLLALFDHLCVVLIRQVLIPVERFGAGRFGGSRWKLGGGSWRGSRGS